MITIEPFESCHVEDAVKLALAGLDGERVHVAALPISDFTQKLTDLISEHTARHYGVAAIENGRLAGYLSGAPVNAYKSLQRGIYCPIHAHGATGDKRRVYQQMYQDIAAVWVRNGCLTHAITLYAHDEPSVSAWFDMAFGKRCMEAIRTLAPLNYTVPQGITIREAQLSDVADLLPLYNEDTAYFSSSPLFMSLPRFYDEGTICQELRAARHVWAAFTADGPVGIMKLKPTGEGFIADSPGMMNLYDVYLRPEARGAGLATAILGTIIDWMSSQGLTRIGTDYEGFNLLGSRFWSKHFAPYTYSLFRRIDERVLWANGDRLKEIII